jgi:uncharacterized membrane protein YhiD involved in acid resistance
MEHCVDALLTGMFSANPGGEVPLEEFALRLLVAFLVGQAVGWTYSRSHGALSYSQNFVQSLVLLSMVVCVIMAVVGDNLARAFGLGAALAIVRFRTPVKDSRDTTFLFLSVAVGMAAGAGQLALAAFGAAATTGVAMWLHSTAYGVRSQAEGILRFRFMGSDEQRDAMGKILSSHCRVFRLSGARTGGPGDPEELAYDVDLRKPDQGDLLIRELTASGGITGITLLAQARLGEG